MKNDLTIAKLKNTSFLSLYSRFVVGKPLSSKEYETILALAICFTWAADEMVRRLGYRIIVAYCNQRKEYSPLYEIAINKGLYPVSKFIEKHHVTEGRRNFFTEWNDAFTEQYADNGTYRSEQQRELMDFFAEKKQDTLSVIAPTSYGKSELIALAVHAFAAKKVCVITSSKALLMQTKKRIHNVSKGLFSKIIVHPEMYNEKDSSCLAVLTQERLLRLLKKDPRLAFDCIIVDEAHEMLEKGTRSQTLATALIVAKKRNPSVVFKFLTPFLSEAGNLKARFAKYSVDAFKVSEYIKSEKYFVYDVKNGTGLSFYDQFMNSFISIPSDDTMTYEEDVVKAYSAKKNIVYLNKPADIERFALSLAELMPEIQSERVLAACEHMANYLQPQYNLISCLRKGIIYHHGSVPDAIRIYVEELYRSEAEIKFIVTSSTLLSGVNLPAERMFILDNRRGRGNLRTDSFKNLVGRVCRFSEIFNDIDGSLQRLEPHVYLVYGKYFAQNANCKTFLQKVASVSSKYDDNLANVLLENTKIDKQNEEELRQASEFIENYENGVIQNYRERYTLTEVGKSCVMNSVNEIDIFANEVKMQKKVEQQRRKQVLISDCESLMEAIQEIVLQYVSDKGEENLERLKNKEARSFYAMLLAWRMSDKSYSEMIRLFVGYWGKLYRQDRDAIIYAGKWGDIARAGSQIKHYTRLNNKTRTQIVNLAIVRIKEEQDFIDNTLIKYVEVLHDLGVLDEKFYFRIKYGTDDESIICLIKNGLSLSSSVLLLKKYEQYVALDKQNSTVSFDDDLIYAMRKENENQILIYEVENCM